MADTPTPVRWGDKPLPVELNGNEQIPATSVNGGETGDGTPIDPGSDIHYTPAKLLAWLLLNFGSSDVSFDGSDINMAGPDNVKAAIASLRSLISTLDDSITTVGNDISGYQTTLNGLSDGLGTLADALGTTNDAVSTAQDAITYLQSLTTGNVVKTFVGGVIQPTNFTTVVRISGLNADVELLNPTGTPLVDGVGFTVYLEDDGTPRALTYGSKYANSEFAAMPAITVAGKRHRFGFEYNADDDMFYCMYAQVES